MKKHYDSWLLFFKYVSKNLKKIISIFFVERDENINIKLNTKILDITREREREREEEKKVNHFNF